MCLSRSPATHKTPQPCHRPTQGQGVIMAGAPLALVLPQEFTSRHLYIILLPRMMRSQSLQEGLLPWQRGGKHRKARLLLNRHWSNICPLPISWLYQLEHLSPLCPSQPKLPPGGNVMVPPSPILIRRRPGLSPPA